MAAQTFTFQTFAERSMSSRLIGASLAGLVIALVPVRQSPAHEIVGNRFFPATLTIDDPGVNDEWGGSGDASVGAEPFHHYVPNIYFGKGLGDLPDTLSWIRPVAITGQVGYSIPARNFTTTFSIDPDSGALSSDTEFHPRVLNWGGTIQYSMPYLKSAVIDLGLPDFIDHLIPLVEANLQTPIANTITSGTLTTGTINPGVIWVGNYFQVGVEALIPINRQSGTNVGVIAQLHLYLDDIDPRGIGKPLFGGPVQPASPFPR
jgi:hypothetical protein